MKYLRIHKLIWFALILIQTLFEVLCYFIFCVCYLLWCLKWKWNWKEYTSYEMLDYTTQPHGVRRIITKNLCDNSVWNTIVRRYKCDFRI